MFSSTLPEVLMWSRLFSCAIKEAANEGENVTVQAQRCASTNTWKVHYISKATLKHDTQRYNKSMPVFYFMQFNPNCVPDIY